jgi:flagellar biosynthesis protein FlhF
MNARKFVAATARDALRKVKDTLGPDAIILSNRGVPGGVEIIAVASLDMEIIDAPSTRDGAKVNEDYTVKLSPQAPVQANQTNAFSTPPRSQTARPTTPASEQRPIQPHPLTSPIARPAAQNEAPRAPLSALNKAPKAEAEVVPAEVMTEIRALRRMVEQHLAGFAWGESARSEPVKTEVLRQMLDAGFSPQLSRGLLAELPHQLDGGQALAWVKGGADRSLLTLNAENDIVDRGGIYALVGPTGVGKTTTTAKLAARCVLRHGASKVALVTTDGYRIGAHEQLRIYGRILGVSVHLVKDSEDLQQTLQDLQHKHMVLIDTMGMSQRDRLVEEQIAMFGASHVKRLLLLSATVRGDTLDDVVRAYRGEEGELAGCILTKVDEAASLATSLDVIMRHSLRLHYVSNGQRVPEDLHLPNRAYLLHRAFKDLPENSPHRLDGIEPAMLMANASSDMLALGGRRG